MSNDRGMIEQHAGNTRLIRLETISAGQQHLKITNVRISTVSEGLVLQGLMTHDQKAKRDPVWHQASSSPNELSSRKGSQPFPNPDT